MFNDDNLIKIDNWYWTKEDVPAYEYLKNSHVDEMKNILPFLTSQDVAIQAGAHCGYVINNLEKHFRTIYTFEPDNTMFLALCLNISNKNVFKFQACLGEENKLVGMAKSEYFPFRAGAKYVKGEDIIPMITIDNLELMKCDLIMLDIEGYEYYALLGGKKTIEKFKPVLCLERYWGIRTINKPESILENLLLDWGYIEVAKTGESLQDHIYKYKGGKK